MATYSSIKYNIVADNAVTVDKIVNSAITAGKLSNTLDLSGKTVTLPNTSVTNAMLAGSIDLTSKVTGALPVAKGGTGLTSVGSANQSVAVNSGASALEFQTVASTWEYHYQTQDQVGTISSGNQIGNSLTFTPGISGAVLFSGSYSYRHGSAAYAYFSPRQGSTKLMEFGHNYATSASNHNQGFTWASDGGDVTSSSSVSYNLMLSSSGGSINNDSDNGNQLHLLVEVSQDYTR